MFVMGRRWLQPIAEQFEFAPVLPATVAETRLACLMWKPEEELAASSAHNPNVPVGVAVVVVVVFAAVNEKTNQ